MSQLEKLSNLLKESNIGFSLDESHSFAGTQRGAKSIILNPCNHRKVEGFVFSECEFIFSADGTLLGVRLNEAESFDDGVM